MRPTDRNNTEQITRTAPPAQYHPDYLGNAECALALVSKVSWPRGVKWRCDADASVLKKARGLTSLWADAVRQIPAGEMGCVYIAYTEAMRAALADARTQHLIDTVRNKDLFHRASVGVPLTVIDRLYPQALDNGGLELIESIIPMTMDGYEFMLDDWPLRVFTVAPPA